MNKCLTSILFRIAFTFYDIFSLSLIGHKLWKEKKYLQFVDQYAFWNKNQVSKERNINL